MCRAPRSARVRTAVTRFETAGAIVAGAGVRKKSFAPAQSLELPESELGDLLGRRLEQGNGVAGVLAEHIGDAQPAHGDGAVVVPGQPRVLRALQPVLVAEEEVRDLLKAAESEERERLAEDQVQHAAVARLGGETIGVGGRLGERPHRLLVGIAPRRAVGKAAQVLHASHFHRSRGELPPEGLGDGRAVDLDEGAICAGTGAVDHAGKQTLARARLALNEDGREAPRVRLALQQPPDLCPDGLDSRTVADQLGQKVHETYRLPAVERYNRIPLQTARGCHLDCEFCAASKIFGGYKRKPVETVTSELREIKRHVPHPFLELADDNTFVDKRWSRDLVKALGTAEVHWFTETDVSLADDPELLDLLAGSGCRQVLIGLESPSAASLQGIEAHDWKARRHDRYRRAINEIQRRGITVNGCFIVGFDNDTPDIFEHVERFVKKSGLMEVQVTVLTPFPGTALYHRLRAEGRLLRERYWERCTLFDVNFVPKKMSGGELVHPRPGGLRPAARAVRPERRPPAGVATLRSRARRLRLVLALLDGLPGCPRGLHLPRARRARRRRTRGA